MKLKVFFVSESRQLRDGGSFYAAENAVQARQLFLHSDQVSTAGWAGTTQEMVGTFSDGEPRKLDLRFA